MTNYYFLAASLPTLSLDVKPEISFEDLKFLFQVNLKKEDLKKTQVIARLIDLENLLALFHGGPLDPRGTLDLRSWEEGQVHDANLPEYVAEFLIRYPSKEERIRNFPFVVSRYFIQESPKEEGFLKDYLMFERSSRLVLAALRAKKLKSDVAEVMQFEDFSDPLVAHILAQKDALSYEPPYEFSDLKPVFISCGSDPFAYFTEINRWRFNRLEELVKRPLFSMDWILGYMVRIMLLENIWSLNQKNGETTLNKMVEKG